MSVSIEGRKGEGGLYHRRHKRAWWTERPGYARFMVRELTSVFIAGYLVVLIATLAKAGSAETAGGSEQLASWLAKLGEPMWMTAHALALVAAVWHSITWFGAVPQAMPIRLGEKKLPASLAAVLMGYGPWLTVTGAILAWGLWASGRL